MKYCKLSFISRDASTKEPLAGSIFQLSSDGIPLASAAANAKGVVDFGSFATGTYELAEISVPSGYLPNTTTYTVIVTSEDILVNGFILSDFSPETIPLKQSQPPAVAPLHHESPQVSGKGIPGCTITVTLPDGTVLDTLVDSSGNWQAGIPTEYNLQPGEVITAQQTGASQLISKPASQVVRQVLLCTITYDANGGLGDNTIDRLKSDRRTRNNSCCVKTPEEAGITRETFFFAAWNTAADGSGDYYFPSEILNTTRDISLYAQWIYAGPYHMVRYEPNGGTGGLTVPDRPEGSRCTIATADEAQTALPGWIFKSWNSSPDGSGRVYLPGDTLVLVEDLTLYAQWQ